MFHLHERARKHGRLLRDKREPDGHSTFKLILLLGGEEIYERGGCGHDRKNRKALLLMRKAGHFVVGLKAMR